MAGSNYSFSTKTVHKTRTATDSNNVWRAHKPTTTEHTKLRDRPAYTLAHAKLKCCRRARARSLGVYAAEGSWPDAVVPVAQHDGGVRVRKGKDKGCWNNLTIYDSNLLAMDLRKYW